MANKNNRISVNSLEKCVKEAVAEPTVTKEWRGINFNIKIRLGLKEMMTFVDGVVKTCFTQDGTQYTPEVLDFAIRCSVLEMYANFALPTNIEHRYELVYGCDAFQIILDTIDRAQFDSMLRAIDVKIAHIANAKIEAITNQVNELYAALSSLEERLGSAFNGIDNDTISNLAKALSDGKFDERKLVHAYMDAKNTVERVEEKTGE